MEKYSLARVVRCARGLLSYVENRHSAEILWKSCCSHGRAAESARARDGVYRRSEIVNPLRESRVARRLFRRRSQLIRFRAHPGDALYFPDPRAARLLLLMAVVDANMNGAHFVGLDLRVEEKFLTWKKL